MARNEECSIQYPASLKDEVLKAFQPATPSQIGETHSVLNTSADYARRKLDEKGITDPRVKVIREFVR